MNAVKDESVPGRVRVLHEGVEVGHIQVNIVQGEVWVKYAERTADPDGSGGAFASAYHELMDLFGVNTVGSDTKLSSMAVRFWHGLRPMPPVRKFSYRTACASEAEHMGELEPPDRLETRLYDEVETPLQDYRYFLSRDPVVWEKEGMREFDIPWNWEAPASVLELMEEWSEMFEFYDCHTTAAQARGAAVSGSKLPSSSLVAEGETEDVVVELPGDTHRELMQVSEPPRQTVFTGWVLALLESWEHQCEE